VHYDKLTSSSSMHQMCLVDMARARTRHTNINISIVLSLPVVGVPQHDLLHRDLCAIQRGRRDFSKAPLRDLGGAHHASCETFESNAYALQEATMLPCLIGMAGWKGGGCAAAESSAHLQYLVAAISGQSEGGPRKDTMRPYCHGKTRPVSER
jgi:hypothetical protein